MRGYLELIKTDCFQIARFTVKGTYKGIAIEETVNLDYGFIKSMSVEDGLYIVNYEVNQYIGEILDCIDGTYSDEYGMGDILGIVASVMRPNRVNVRLRKKDIEALWP